MSGYRTYPKEIFERELNKLAKKMSNSSYSYSSMDFIIPIRPSLSNDEVELIQNEALIKHLILEIRKKHCA